MSMEIQGKSICEGLAVGIIRLLKKQERKVTGESVRDAEAECRRFEGARIKAVGQVQELCVQLCNRSCEKPCDKLPEQLYDKLPRQLYEQLSGEDCVQLTEILEAYQMILKDEEYVKAVVSVIREQSVKAEDAVVAAGEQFAQLLRNSRDDYFQDRCMDIQDVTDRLLGVLQEVREADVCSMQGDLHREVSKPCSLKQKDPIQEELKQIDGGQYIFMAEELTPTDILRFEKELPAGLITKKGTYGSHTAILTRSRRIPALTGVEIMEEWDGKWAILDIARGCLILDPDPGLLGRYQERIRQQKDIQQKHIQQQKDMQQKDMQFHCSVSANISDVMELKAVLANGADGIGLFRSEFMYLQEASYPTEEALYQTYKQAAECMEGKQVIIRTIDIGGDKTADYFGLPKEENPALGCRGIRLSLKKQEIFRTQLRAILRAAAWGNVAVMYPMITSLWEVRRIRELIEEVKQELDKDGISYGKCRQGIMIETPAAAVISDLLAQEVDFFSIGTNDLVQYTLAVDRQDPELDKYYDTHHEAVLRLIRLTVKNAHKAGIPVGICGEMAADLTMAHIFAEMGVDELSVSPDLIPRLKEALSPPIP